MADWISRARNELEQLRHPKSGWGYRVDSEPATEATVLGSLALLSQEREDPAALRACFESAHWLAKCQQPDGAVGVTETLTEPPWTTSYALLLLSCLGIEVEAAQRCEDWLLRHQGMTFVKPPGTPLGHNTELAGWSWVERTHSWLEPTALAVIALKRAGQRNHPRVLEGLELIRDRAVPTGGWNFGNSTVFDRPLRSKPGPTGLALLALAGTQGKTTVVSQAVDWLGETLPNVRSAQSLGLGLLGMAAWGERPDDADGWLEHAAERVVNRPDRACSYAYLLLAASDRSLELLGVSPKNSSEVAVHE